MSEGRFAPYATRWLPVLVAYVLAVPSLAQDMSRITQVTLPDGGVMAGDLQSTEAGLEASNATITWADGRTYTGEIFGGVPIRGTLRYPDGSSIRGVIDDLDNSGARRWLPGVSQVHTIRESTLGPPGTYRLGFWSNRANMEAWAFGAPFQPDRLQGLPLDAATLAKPTRNTKGCPKPSVVPAGWVVWWPLCTPGSEAILQIFSPDGTQRMVQYFSPTPDRQSVSYERLDGKSLMADMLIEYGADSLTQDIGGTFFPYRTNFYAKTAKPASIRAKAFTADAAPLPIGEGRLYAADFALLFEGTFHGPLPAIGNCRIPINEGKAMEPCEFRNGQRIDPAHMQRQEQVAALKREADVGPQQARERSSRWKQEQDQRLAQEDERIRQRNRARDAVNEVNWGAVMNDVGNTFQRSADELEASRRENARRMEQARRSDEAYRAEQQRAAQRQAQQASATNATSTGGTGGGTGTGAGGSSLTLTVNQAGDNGDTAALAARNEEISRRMREENERRLMKLKVQYRADGRACYAHPELQSPELQTKLDGDGCTSPGRSGGPGVIGDP